jgi:Leucine-rich repeat (LRR) protein
MKSICSICLFTVFLTVFWACNNSNQAEEEATDSTEAIESKKVLTDNEFVPDPNFDYKNCPKSWSLKELMAKPDSFCLLALLGEEGKQLTEFPEELKKAPYLRSIDARRNRISSIPAFLSKLEELDLGQNGLKNLPDGLKYLKNVRKLNFDYNSIAELGDAIYEMKNLEELWLFDNSLEEIPVKLCNMTGLKVLALSGNQLTSIPPEIGQLSNLEKLFLNDQPSGISSLPNELSKLQKLTNLSIGSGYSGGGTGNGFTEIPACIFELENLKELDLSYGKIEQVSSDIEKLRNLEMLSLAGNQLTELPVEMKNLKNLKYLYLGNNNFSGEQQEIISSWFGENTYVEFEEEIGD